MNNYTLFHKKQGVQSLEVFSNFNHLEEIRDICAFKEKSFALIDNKSLFILDENGIEKILTVHNPMSVCSVSDSTIYVSYEKGIKKVEYSNGYVISEFLSPIDCEKIYKKLDKIGVWGVRIDNYEGRTAILIEPINICYLMDKELIVMKIGNNSSGYSISNNITNSSICLPQGVAIYDSKTVIISDSGNGCIRSFGDKHKIIAGSPTNKELNPTKIVLDRQRSILYFLSGDQLKSVNLSSGRNSIVYTSKNLKSITLDCNSKIYILEGVNK